jgi:L-histidine N-alpha-methyltransferase
MEKKKTFDEQRLVIPKTNARSATEEIERFRSEVLEGLSKPQKSLPSKYFYDATGDELYNKIMATDEYYLTRSEMEIFGQRTEELFSVLVDRYKKFSLVELGPGDIRKSIHLISALYMERVDFEYTPIDISKNVIGFLGSSLPHCFPNLPIHPMNGEYLEMLHVHNKIRGDRPTVILCLGGNIANMLPEDTHQFCRSLRSYMKRGDLAVIGFDLKKNPRVIRAAYNDKKGVTAEFNLNLLTRINRELGATFDIQKFEHYCAYDPETGACKSYLVCLEAMEVVIGDKLVTFDKDECIWMEISQKYSGQDIERMAATAGFSVVGNICDSNNWFRESIWMAE